ncbi:MAG: hypothetical protein ACOVR6_12240 [Fimbriimonas sp.]
MIEVDDATSGEEGEKKKSVHKPPALVVATARAAAKGRPTSSTPTIQQPLLSAVSNGFAPAAPAADANLLIIEELRKLSNQVLSFNASLNEVKKDNMELKRKLEDGRENNESCKNSSNKSIITQSVSHVSNGAGVNFAPNGSAGQTSSGNSDSSSSVKTSIIGSGIINDAATKIDGAPYRGKYSDEYFFYADMRLKEVHRKAQLDAEAAERYRQHEQDHLALELLRERHSRIY